MHLYQFQEASKRTLPDEGIDDLTNYALGLIGESAEVTEHIKKWRFHKHDLNQKKVAEELGDVLHYLAGICSMMELNLEEVAADNIKKLKERYPEGFDKEKSRKRDDLNG